MSGGSTLPKTVLLDAGWFVGRMQRHFHAKRGLIPRMTKLYNEGRTTLEKLQAVHRRFTYTDLKYLEFRFRQFGCSPQYGAKVIICYDGTGGRQRRGQQFTAYKGNRAFMAEGEEYDAAEYSTRDMRHEFIAQGFEPELRSKWTYLYDDSKEADDVIAEYVAANHKKEQLFVFSGDSDILQLLRFNNVRIFDVQKEFTKTDLWEKYGCSPSKYADWKALCGDTSDNIPGLPGIGAKKAADLINEYGTIENIPERELMLWYPKDKSKLAEYMMAWRHANKKGLDFCKRNYGVGWEALERMEDSPLTSQKLEKMKVIPEAYFEGHSQLDVACMYRNIIHLPFT